AGGRLDFRAPRPKARSPVDDTEPPRPPPAHSCRVAVGRTKPVGPTEPWDRRSPPQREQKRHSRPKHPDSAPVGSWMAHARTRSRILRVLVVDDSTLVCEFLRELIDEEPDMLVVGTAHNGADTLELVRKLKPD